MRNFFDRVLECLAIYFVFDGKTYDEIKDERCPEFWEVHGNDAP